MEPLSSYYPVAPSLTFQTKDGSLSPALHYAPIALQDLSSAISSISLAI